VNNITVSHEGKLVNFLSKLAILLTACEQHLLYNVMWCALVLSPYIFSNNLDGFGFVFFMILNWGSRFVLDCMYRQLISGRTHFEPQNILLRKKTSSSSSTYSKLKEEEGDMETAVQRYQQQQTVVVSCGDGEVIEFATRMSSALALTLHALSFMLSPISDFFLFVIPTFHAHIKMAFTSDFKYIVAPKGKESIINIPNSPLLLTSTTSTTNTTTVTTMEARQGASIGQQSVRKVYPQQCSIVTLSEKAPLMSNTAKSQEMKTYS
jgi:formylmethanofuran dehydrogenase subunit D